MEKKLSLRLVEGKDIKMIFDWRNNTLVRQNSFSTQPISWDEHVKWFNDTIKNPNILFFIMMCDGNVVGQTRIDLVRDNVAIIDYSIAEQHRGLGYGETILHLYRRGDV